MAHLENIPGMTPGTVADLKPAPVRQGVPPIVEFKGVTKTYFPGTPRAFTAIRNVDFVVEDIEDVGNSWPSWGPAAAEKAPF